MATAQEYNPQRPIPGILFGITHDTDGGLIIKEQKLVKVGIGPSKGPALTVFTQVIDGKLKWRIVRGFSNDDGPNKKIAVTRDTRAEAESLYYSELPKAPVCPYPRKFPYFTFTTKSIFDGQEIMVPDFAAIEAHGPTPTEIDIVLLDDNPFTGEYQYWSSSELRCHGDGITASRVLSMASTDDEKEAAKLAMAAGERYFPIIHNCARGGCKYIEPGTDARGKETPPPCKPHGDLKFQLAFSLRIGGVAYFSTTGIRSIQYLTSSLWRISNLVGSLAGIPLKMTLKPYRTNHNGQAATQYGVNLELRAESMVTLRRMLEANLFTLRELASPEKKQVHLIEAGDAHAFSGDEDDVNAAPTNETAAGAAPATSEPAEVVPQSDVPQASLSASNASTATQTKTNSLSARMAESLKTPTPPKPGDAKDLF